MQMISGEDVHRLLGYPSLVAALKTAHRNPVYSAGEAILSEPADGDPERAFITLPAWQKDGLIGVKLVTVFPGNPSEHSARPANQGLYVCFDPTNGTPTLVADGTALTLRKTAADTALGIDFLASPDARTLLVLGAGALAPHVIEAALAVRPGLVRVQIWNRTLEKAERLAASLTFDGVSITAAADLADALPIADIVVSATMATEPLVRGALLKPGSHVNLIGSWRPDMRECDDDTIRRAELYTDSREACRDCGEFFQSIEKGLMSWDDIKADLFDLCRGDATSYLSGDGVTLFKNAGGAHLDLFTAQELLARHSAGL
ncbi:ornithine cyclodeaminase [Rhizobium sp. S95]|uniref:Ornithine cyclodeaminase n=1 Tax=Ciceribacter sichuanensis TaxID=2949647 RepID=A0AAJ1BZR1_9HYPH|nr:MULTISPECIES: ornithine cyclodeaminase [unclassified Ciceribacter]MCM2397224.1 ornithine cyclodeaminase [Ciceribacter sp. S95]MCO5959126.1 ornithine cyclodeaminase [Ciceribacter sp. S101]